MEFKRVPTGSTSKDLCSLQNDKSKSDRITQYVEQRFEQIGDKVPNTPLKHLVDPKSFINRYLNCLEGLSRKEMIQEIILIYNDELTDQLRTEYDELRLLTHIDNSSWALFMFLKVNLKTINSVLLLSGFGEVDLSYVIYEVLKMDESNDKLNLITPMIDSVRVVEVDPAIEIPIVICEISDSISDEAMEVLED